MALNTPLAQLNTAHKRLNQRWEATKSVWNDSVQQDFEKRYFQPLERQTQATLKEMERLAQVIAKARRHLK
ncbi:MAG: hypothetical protein ACPGWR_03370 [Ardenticatenaceae bacterium]